MKPQISSWRGPGALPTGPVPKKCLHDTVNHVDEQVRGQVHTQGIDNFWSLLKRTPIGIFAAVEPYRLSRYVDEQAFRYNNRATKDNPPNDADRFTPAASQNSGKRPTYAKLAVKTSGTQAAI